MTLRVLIADDQHLVRSGLKMILQANGLNVVGEAEDGASADHLRDQHQVADRGRSLRVTNETPE